MNNCLHCGSRADCCHRNVSEEKTFCLHPAADTLYNSFYLSITLQGIHSRPHIKADQPPLGPILPCRRTNLQSWSQNGAGAALHHGAQRRLCPCQALGARTCLSRTGKVPTTLCNGHPPGQSFSSDPEILLCGKMQEAAALSSPATC